jgi:hypothetical protein
MPMTGRHGSFLLAAAVIGAYGAAWGPAMPQSAQRGQQPAPPAGSLYRVKVLVIRPTVPKPPSDAEFTRDDTPWHAVKVPEGIKLTAPSQEILSRLRKANKGFRFDSVIASSTVSIAAGQAWQYHNADTTRAEVTVLRTVPGSAASSPAIKYLFKGEFRAAPRGGASAAEESGGRLSGSSQVPAGTFAAFNAGQSFTMVTPPGKKQGRYWVHTPRDLVLLAIEPVVRGQTSR